MLDLEILYEDKNILAINKPAGMVVHHDAEHISGTIVDWLLEKYPQIRGVGHGVGHSMSNSERPGIVHRLDKDTSGILLVAKTQGAQEYLKNLFKTGGINKKYLALVVGNMKNNSGVIDAAIARSTKHFEKRVVGGGQGRARAAVTEYKVLERFSGGSTSVYTLLEVSPKTGRTHQIRSHLAHIGYPVACDKLYGGGRYACPPELEHQALHAFSLSFKTPSGTLLELEAQPPEYFERALEALRTK